MKTHPFKVFSAAAMIDQHQLDSANIIHHGGGRGREIPGEPKPFPGKRQQNRTCHTAHDSGWFPNT